ncbi:hypothetical protein D3C87_1989810 [compost metagenome]
MQVGHGDIHFGRRAEVLVLDFAVTQLAPVDIQRHKLVEYLSEIRRVSHDLLRFDDIFGKQ